MVILLDIDGVLVTTPAWRKVELLADGFMKFNERAAKNLARILEKTNAAVVLTTTHRINYSGDDWVIILNARGILVSSISKINDVKSIADMGTRADEISAWLSKHKHEKCFVVIDDDLTINGLPKNIKDRCVLTKPLIGLDDAATEKVLSVLSNTLA